MLTDAQRILLEDKFVLWDRNSREGNLEMRDYHRRAADALKAALSLASAYIAPPTPQPGEVERLRSAHLEIVSRDDANDPFATLNEYERGYASAMNDCGNIARAALTPSESGEAGPQWTCTRCGRDEIDARANGCTRGPCPMVPR